MSEERGALVILLTVYATGMAAVGLVTMVVGLVCAVARSGWARVPGLVWPPLVAEAAVVGALWPAYYLIALWGYARWLLWRRPRPAPGEPGH